MNPSAIVSFFTSRRVSKVSHQQRDFLPSPTIEIFIFMRVALRVCCGFKNDIQETVWRHLFYWVAKRVIDFGNIFVIVMLTLKRARDDKRVEKLFCDILKRIEGLIAQAFWFPKTPFLCDEKLLFVKSEAFDLWTLNWFCYFMNLKMHWNMFENNSD